MIDFPHLIDINQIMVLLTSGHEKELGYEYWSRMPEKHKAEPS